MHAVTDVTGFGLAGHGWEMAERSRRPPGRSTRRALVAYRRRARGSRVAACAPAATPATATTSPGTSSSRRRPPSRRCASTRRPRAACSPRSTRRSSARSSTPGSWRIGAVEAGEPAVVLAVKPCVAHSSSDAAGAHRVASSASCGSAVTTSSSASTRSGGARGPARSWSARPCCPATGGSTGSATRSCSPRPSGRSCSTGSPRGASRGRSGARQPGRVRRARHGRRPAARRAAGARGLGVVPDAAVVDGNWDFVSPHVAHVDRRVKADARCLSVAAASILAKVTRDRMMREHAEHYPALVVRHQQGLPVPVAQGRPAGLRPVGDPPPHLGVHGPPPLAGDASPPARAGAAVRGLIAALPEAPATGLGASAARSRSRSRTGSSSRRARRPTRAPCST